MAGGNINNTVATKGNLNNNNALTAPPDATNTKTKMEMNARTFQIIKSFLVRVINFTL